MSKRIALVIGNSHYRDQKLARLKTPAADVHLLAATLRDPAIGDFDEVETLVDQPASEVRRHVRDLFRRRNHYDLLLFYFAGHSLLDEAGQTYLAAVDTAPDSLETTAVPATYVTEWIERSFSRRQLLILDCHTSQVLAPGAVCLPEARARTAAAFRGKGCWHAVLAASDNVHYILAGDSVGGKVANSVFTHYLIEGLQTGAADANKDGLIDVRELYDYVHDQVSGHPAVTKPRYWTYSKRDELIVAGNPKKFEQERVVKWDLVFGAIMAPTATLAIGGPADFGVSLGMAIFFFLVYALLYRVPD